MTRFFGVSALKLLSFLSSSLSVPGDFTPSGVWVCSAVYKKGHSILNLWIFPVTRSWRSHREPWIIFLTKRTCRTLSLNLHLATRSFVAFFFNVPFISPSLLPFYIPICPQASQSCALSGPWRAQSGHIQRETDFVQKKEKKENQWILSREWENSCMPVQFIPILFFSVPSMPIIQSEQQTYLRWPTLTESSTSVSSMYMLILVVVREIVRG